MRMHFWRCFPLLAVLFLPGLVMADTDWQPQGSATAKWLGWIDIYDARLWVGPEVTRANLLADDTPVKLELCYHRALSPDDFVTAAESGLPKTLPTAQRLAVERLHARYQAVEAGDCYQLEHQPGQGLQLRLNDRTVFVNDTPGFKAVYLGLWLGDSALSTEVKHALLAPLK
ncbi:chalcone isomerase family protein [Hydrogenovibrio halophilus]|uniref:chalcone isomerase family protein n=1 Tax=Hydrogenovibrio halophilus TaxID=373391 RepID=UPI00037FC632|nr:chalcone isomerase family protein [Hydrogenovibrio halophilus]